MRMYLKSIALAGYRSYHGSLEENRVNLSNRNVIIGANGAGKSNLISFFDMISFMMTQGLGAYVAKQGYADSLLYFGKKTTERICGRLEVSNPLEDGGGIYLFDLEWDAQDGFFFSNEAATYHHPIKTVYIHQYGGGHRESRLAEKGVRGDSAEKTLYSYLRGLRVFHFHDTSLSSRMRAMTNLSKSDWLYSDGGNLAAFLHRLKNSETENAYYQRIVRYIRRVMPQFRDFVLIPDNNGYLSLKWRQSGSEEVFGPHQFSDGTLRFLALTTLLLQPPSVLPMTVILDEPEIGLHPYALSLLNEELRIAGANAQIILATQSTALLDAFSPDDIITVDYDSAKNCSVLRRHSTEALDQWLKEYTLGELWEKNVLGGLPI